jgi:5'-methylthioadenosine phosphorylase
MNSEKIIGLIGGSGVYSLFKDESSEKETIKTQFGKVTVSKIEFDDKMIVFLPRHGSSHSIPPHMINFKANILALHLKGVKSIIATNAVGSLKKKMKPGDFVVIDQFIDIVSGPHTFFDGRFEVEIDGTKFKGVQHTDVTSPYNYELREILIQSISQFPEETCHTHGCYVMFNGPRFESAAEINMFKNFGDVVGMTGAPEVILSRELNIDYASINMVTNYGAGIQSSVSHGEVIEIFEKKIDILKKILIKALSYI